MKISVIIPTLNEERNVSIAVETAWMSGADEVIVADGGSSDSTVEITDSLDCQLIVARLGRGKQLNAGAEIATGDVLLFLHADTTLCPSGCVQIRDAMRSPGCMCGAFRQSISSNKSIYRLIEIGNAYRVSILNMAYGDQGIFVRRTLYDKIGGFDEIPLMEDFCFSQKIKRQNHYKLLAGPINVSPRRWQANGPVRQTVSNWMTALAYMRGVDPELLSKKYYGRD